MKRTLITIAVNLWVVALCASANAYYEEFSPATTEGRGGAGIASAEGTDSAFYNPAALTIAEDYQLSLGSIASLDGFYYPLALSLFDSVTNPWLCTHIGFTFINQRRELTYDKSRDVTYLEDIKDEKTYAIRLGLAVPLYQKFISLGVGLKWFIGDREKGSTRHRVGFDVGTVIQPTEGFRIGVTAYNVARKDFAEFGQAVGFGLAGSLSVVDLEGDYIIYYTRPGGDTHTSHAANAGATFKISWFRGSLGYSYNQTGQRHAVSFGLGYVGDTADFILAYNHVVSAEADTEPTNELGNGQILINLRFHFGQAIKNIGN